MQTAFGPQTPSIRSAWPCKTEGVCRNSLREGFIKFRDKYILEETAVSEYARKQSHWGDWKGERVNEGYTRAVESRGRVHPKMHEHITSARKLLKS
eukprot:2976734-Pleurochrysis_carterae.AAC.2